MTNNTRMNLILSSIVCTVAGHAAAFTLSALKGVAIRDMNDAGQIVGNIDLGGGRTRAAIFFDGVLHDLGTLGGASSEAYATNNRGQVVGMADDGHGMRAFLYDAGRMNALDGLAYAYDINDAGEIAGRYGNFGMGAVYRNSVVAPLFTHSAAAIIASRMRSTTPGRCWDRSLPSGSCITATSIPTAWCTSSTPARSAASTIRHTI